MNKLLVSSVAVAGLAFAATAFPATAVRAQNSQCAQEVEKLSRALNEWSIGNVGSSGSPYPAQLQNARDAAQAGNEPQCMSIVESLKSSFNRQGIIVPE